MSMKTLYRCDCGAEDCTSCHPDYDASLQFLEDLAGLPNEGKLSDFLAERLMSRPYVLADAVRERANKRVLGFWGVVWRKFLDRSQLYTWTKADYQFMRKVWMQS